MVRTSVLSQRRVNAMPTDFPGTSTVSDPGLDQDKDLDTSGPRIRCPLCGWSPRQEDHRLCSCGHEGNTFEKGGFCPAAFTSGLRPSAFHALAGRCIRIGMHVYSGHMRLPGHWPNNRRTVSYYI